MNDPQHVVTWAHVAIGVGSLAFFGLALSLLVPIPWILLAAWLEERSKTKRILAQARLQEAQNAARTFSEAGGRADG